MTVRELLSAIDELKIRGDITDETEVMVSFTTHDTDYLSDLQDVEKFNLYPHVEGGIQVTTNPYTHEEHAEDHMGNKVDPIGVALEIVGGRVDEEVKE